MTMWQHQLLSFVILLFLWHVWIKHHFYTQKNYDDIEDEVNHWLDK
ncbi:MAG: hypothetical protein P4L31_07775 [Candidatus Babeliales bacterium]|nr:hypothetical protein [Candidatus Babeliales bacterium]